MSSVSLPSNAAAGARPERRPSKAAYALPTLFTAGNLYLGFFAIMKSFEGAMRANTGLLDANPHWEHAAQAIGVAVLLDGLDGRIARMTNTTSEFGKEMDSLADVITFCLAPAVLGVAWGVQFVSPEATGLDHATLLRIGTFLAFLFVLCGAARLARFNISVNPVPKNPGRPDRKYFVGLATPAAAGLVASIVYASSGVPLQAWYWSFGWMALLALLAFLMVSTWRYRSFKDLNLLQPRKFSSVITLGCLIFLIWNFSKPVLLAMGVAYVSSGILVRIGGSVRRRLSRASATAVQREHPAG